MNLVDCHPNCIGEAPPAPPKERQNQKYRRSGLTCGGSQRPGGGLVNHLVRQTPGTRPRAGRRLCGHTHRMNEWMDEWMDEWMIGWMNG